MPLCVILLVFTPKAFDTFGDKLFFWRLLYNYYFH